MPPPKSRTEEYSYQLGAGEKSRGCTQTLKPVLSFSSEEEAEFYLKGSVLYHEHLKSDLGKKYLDGYLEFEYRELGNDGDSKVFEAWLMVVQHSLDYKAEAVEPKRGDEVIVSWRTDDNDEIYRWEGKVSSIRLSLTIKSQIEILVAQPLKDPDMPA